LPDTIAAKPSITRHQASLFLPAIPSDFGFGLFANASLRWRKGVPGERIHLHNSAKARARYRQPGSLHRPREHQVQGEYGRRCGGSGGNWCFLKSSCQCENLLELQSPSFGLGHALQTFFQGPAEGSRRCICSRNRHYAARRSTSSTILRAVSLSSAFRSCWRVISRGQQPAATPDV